MEWRLWYAKDPETILSQTESNRATCEKTKQQKTEEKNDRRTGAKMKRRIETEQEQTEAGTTQVKKYKSKGKGMQGKEGGHLLRVPEEGRVGERRRGNHGRLVARPLMARTRRGRHGVKPGT